MKRRVHTFTAVFAWLAAAACCTVGLTACEEDVAAVLGTGQAFTLYGVLNPRVDTQFVRVFPIEGRLAIGPAAPLDARFVSTDAETGETRVWAETLLVDARGDHAHVYYAPFRAGYGHAYDLAVTGGDGRRSTVSVTVPAEADVRVEPPRIPSPPVVLPVRIEGRVPRLIRLEITYRVAYATGFGPTGTPILAFREYTFPLRAQALPDGTGWTALVNLSDAFQNIRDAVQQFEFYQASFGVMLARLTMRAIAANDAWQAPNDTFDPEVLVQPGLMSNVDNGFGFVGAGYRIELTWLPDDDVVARSGFRPATAAAP